MTNKQRWRQWERELKKAGWKYIGPAMWERDGEEKIMYEALAITREESQ